jgi:hypothetical protein
MLHCFVLRRNRCPVIEGQIIVVDVRKALEEGRVSAPELPPLPADFLMKLGIRRR